jgi:glycosyltransferase involved in cell wall biosynthesis
MSSQAAPLALAGPAMPGAESAGVCILSRKDLRNITRVPRMAKALSDAGFRVVVVSLRAPVRELREMSRGVDYVEVGPRPFTARIVSILNFRVFARNRRLQADAEALAGGGWRALAVRVWRLLTAPFAGDARLVRRYLLAAPSAVLLRKPEQEFVAGWHELSGQPAAAILAALVRVWHQQRMTLAFARAADRATRGRAFAVVQAHDNYALVAASRLAARDKARLVYDAVEITEHRLATSFTVLESLFEQRDRRQEAAIFRRADAITTVGKGLSDWYAQHHQIAPPLIVRNCRYYWRYEPDARLRADIGVGPEAPIVAWFGGIYPQQGVEALIDVMPLLRPDVHLAVVAYVLPRWTSYFEEELPRRAVERGVAARVHFLPAREPGDLVPYVSGADLGVIPRPSEHPNNFYSMPNKFLEMVMARLPIAVSRLGDIVDAVQQYGIGESFDEQDLGDMAAVIDRMLDPETNRRLKANVMTAAEDMTWEKESVAYVALVRALARTASLSSEASAPSGQSGAVTQSRNGAK